jgi:hypothetical protein
MCDFSLKAAASRPAKVGDKLVTHNFGTGTRGLAAPEDLTTAVCVMPGTELAFDAPVKQAGHVGLWASLVAAVTDNADPVEHRTAIFRQINKHAEHTHHDALELPDGTVVLLTMVQEGIGATVLQLPAEPKTEVEKQDQTRLAVVG